MDVTCYNAFIFYNIKNPNWSKQLNVKHRRKLFLEELRKQLTLDIIERRVEKIRESSRGYKKTVKNAIEATGISTQKQIEVPKSKIKRGH